MPRLAFPIFPAHHFGFGARLAVLRLLRKRTTGEGEFIFTEKGAMIPPKRMTKAFMRIAKKAGLDLTLHGLRHTHATMLLMAGLPVGVVSRRLNHKTQAVTTDIYGHIPATMQRLAAETMDAILRKTPA